MMDFSFLFNSIVTGLFVGVGSAVGSWLVIRYFMDNGFTSYVPEAGASLLSLDDEEYDEYFIRHLERVKFKPVSGKKD